MSRLYTGVGFLTGRKLVFDSLPNSLFRAHCPKFNRFKGSGKTHDSYL